MSAKKTDPFGAKVVMKPPSADDSHCITIRPMPALIVNVVAGAPVFGHADNRGVA